MIPDWNLTCLRASSVSAACGEQSGTMRIHCRFSEGMLTMSYTHAEHRRAKTAASKAAEQSAAPQPSIDALRAGRMMSAREQLGRSIDLPGAMRAKMEHAFGTDLSAVRLYESEAVGRAGAQAVTRGTAIAFAPGALDLTSRSGQELLGHELSHVVSQARGEVRGSGFLNDPALEARADREGAKAAAGETVYDGSMTGALSDASAASAEGPMQARKLKDLSPEEREELEDELPAYYGLADRKEKEKALERLLKEKDSTPAAKEKRYRDDKKTGSKKLETGLKNIGTLGGRVATISGALADQRQFQESLNETISNYEALFFGAGSQSKPGDLARDAVGEVGKGIEWFQDYANIKDEQRENLRLVTRYSPLAGTAASLPLAVMGFGEKYHALQDAKKTGSRSALANARLDLASSGISASKTGASAVKKVSDVIASVSEDYGWASTLKDAKAVSSVAKQVGSGLGYAGEGVGLLKDVYNLGESSLRKHRMRKSAEAMQGNHLSEEEQEKQMIFRQGAGSAGVDQKQAGFSGVSHALGLGSTIVTSSGVAPAGLGIDLAKKGWDALTGEIMSYEKDKFHTDTVEEKYHLSDKVGAFRQELGNDQTEKLRYLKHVTPEAYREALLRSKGIQSGTDEEGFENVSSERAERLFDAATGGEDWAMEYAKNAGIKVDDALTDEDHTKAVRGSFLKSLGGTEGRKFHSSEMTKYNAFEDDAKENTGFWSYFGNKAKKSRDAAWASLKTGVRHVILAGKSLGRGVAKTARGFKRLVTSKDPWVNGFQAVKTGAGKAAAAVAAGAIKAAGNVRDFATQAETRRNAWESVKTGAARAAGNVRGFFTHGFTSRRDKIKKWYQEGVDQMNLNKETYKKMHVMDRIAWGMKNPLARVLHGTARNKEKTVRRAYLRLAADDAVRFMGQPPAAAGNGPGDQAVPAAPAGSGQGDQAVPAAAAGIRPNDGFVSAAMKLAAAAASASPSGVPEGRRSRHRPPRTGKR